LIIILIFAGTKYAQRACFTLNSKSFKLSSTSLNRFPKRIKDATVHRGLRILPLFTVTYK